jgi:hypothetical protein
MVLPLVLALKSIALNEDEKALYSAPENTNEEIRISWYDHAKFLYFKLVLAFADLLTPTLGNALIEARRIAILCPQAGL